MEIKNSFNKLKNWLTKNNDNETYQTPEMVLERDQPDFDWQYLVTPGHVIFARMNNLKFIAYRLLIILLASVAFLAFAVLTSQKIVNAGIKGFNNNGNQMTDRQSINYQTLLYNSQSFKSKPSGEFTKEADLVEYINQTLTSLNQSNKLPVECNKTDSINTVWASKAGSVDYPMCKSVTGNPTRIWNFAIINSNSRRAPWLGVFINESKYFGFKHEWKYKTVYLPNFLRLKQFEEIEASLIVNSLKSDFSDLPTISNQSNSSSNGFGISNHQRNANNASSVDYTIDQE